MRPVVLCDTSYTMLGRNSLSPLAYGNSSQLRLQQPYCSHSKHTAAFRSFGVACQATRARPATIARRTCLLGSLLMQPVTSMTAKRSSRPMQSGLNGSMNTQPFINMTAMICVVRPALRAGFLRPPFCLWCNCNGIHRIQSEPTDVTPPCAGRCIPA